MRYWQRDRLSRNSKDADDEEATARGQDIYYTQLQQWRGKRTGAMYTTRTMKVKNTVPLYLRKVLPAGGAFNSFNERSRLDEQNKVLALVKLPLLARCT